MAVISKLQVGTSVYDLIDPYIKELLADFPEDNPYLHNAIPRGKNIQEYFDNGSLYTKISNGTFEDLYIGDYWKAKYNGVEKTFRIAGFDTFFNCGNTALTKHHAVIVPDEILNSTTMNSSNSTSGGYKGSLMNTARIGSVVTTGGTSTVNQNLYTIFGNHLLTTSELLTSGVYQGSVPGQTLGSTNGGTPNAWAWVSVQAILMNEMELYGSLKSDGSAYNTGVSCVQLPLFRLIPQMMMSNYFFWLRDVSGMTSFAKFDNDPNGTFMYEASYQAGIRPRFVID